MDRENVFEWLWIVNCFGCGSARIWEAMKEYPSVTKLYQALREPEKIKSMLLPKELKNAKNTDEDKINEIISYCEKHNIYILTFDDEIYPERLRSIYNPPAVLFCRGDLSCLEEDFSLAVVGTRKPSDYSLKLTAALVKELAAFGIGVVSGFAVGIDITASIAAVRSGGKVIEVLGCGLDRDYPAPNVKYRSEIEASGLFVSEYYPKTAGSRASFPARNRILSGLALGTIVVEAGVKSGALVTANLAADQGRDVFAVAPHDLFDRRYGGNVALIRDGAVCLCGLKDIMYEYYENYGHKIANAADRMSETRRKFEQSMAEEKRPVRKLVDAIAPSAAEKENSEYDIDISDLTEEEKKVYNILKKAGKPMLADELAAELDADISDMLSMLTELELNGAVSPAAGQSYAAN
ncbi:MAG: DNA-processing protein DprA [Oscillospiraceae bacterium]|nr:DNA-processing protein DprA [Oscillospiraceae bacterium]